MLKKQKSENIIVPLQVKIHFVSERFVEITLDDFEHTKKGFEKFKIKIMGMAGLHGLIEFPDHIFNWRNIEMITPSKPLG